MEYVSYALITLGIVVACYYLMRPSPLPEDLRLRGDKASGEMSAEERRKETANIRRILQRELMNVPTPWGWPGHQAPSAAGNNSMRNVQVVHGVSESLYHFVDRLFSEKHTVDNAEYLIRRNAAIRAMLEDRYGRASAMAEISYRKVKPPLLRDPSEPHDQMDNFPSGKVKQIMAGIPKQPMSTAAVKPAVPQKIAVGQTKELRTPWGW